MNKARPVGPKRRAPTQQARYKDAVAAGAAKTDDDDDAAQEQPLQQQRKKSGNHVKYGKPQAAGGDLTQEFLTKVKLREVTGVLPNRIGFFMHWLT